MSLKMFGTAASLVLPRLLRGAWLAPLWWGQPKLGFVVVACDLKSVLRSLASVFLHS